MNLDATRRPDLGRPVYGEIQATHISEMTEDEWLFLAERVAIEREDGIMGDVVPQQVLNGLMRDK